MDSFSTFVESVSTNLDGEYQQMLYLHPMNLGGRIALRLVQLGWSQVELLERVPEMNAGTLSATILRDAKKSKFAPHIARALLVNLEWLSTGEGPMQANSSPAQPPGWSNVRPGPDVVGLIPLISWVQAGAFCAAVNVLEPGDAERWIPTLKQYGPHAYALRVQGDSMLSPYPGARSYPPGFIIFVDPDRAITNGCRVIAKLPETEEATFKVYSEDSGKRYLKPLNPQYPITEMTEAMHLCGVVVGGFWEE